MDNKELHQYCLDWVEWCRTRKYYTTPTPKNILARLQPSPSKAEPNGRNDPDMQFFNMAIHTLVDIGGNEEKYACFYFCYVLNARNIKTLTNELKISRQTYYNRVNDFARRAQSMARTLKRVQQSSSMPVNEDAGGVD